MQGVLDALTRAAKLTIPTLLAHELTTHARKALVDCMNFGFDPERNDIGAALALLSHFLWRNEQPHREAATWARRSEMEQELPTNCR
jgi:hypothetical protein